jgi:hypothetical protein
MTVNDIPYDYFQQLLKKAEAFDNGLLDKAKFISVGNYQEYIRTDETTLVNSFTTITERAEYWGSAINAYCHKNNIPFADFVNKYGIKK